MTVLQEQFSELLDSTVSQHGYWLINHQDIIAEDLRSGIVTHGLSKMIERLDDYQSPYVQGLYNKIREAK